MGLLVLFVREGLEVDEDVKFWNGLIEVVVERLLNKLIKFFVEGWVCFVVVELFLLIVRFLKKLV